MFPKMSKAGKRYFTGSETMLWCLSAGLILLFFFLFDRENYLTLAASLIGVTSLIFNAKGNPFGQALMIVFSVLYGAVSYSFAYYGEMATYLGMTAPMAAAALVSWLKNPSEKGRAEVKVNCLAGKEIYFMLFLTAAVTWGFYRLLAALNTANLVPSTVSVATSFLAAYLTFRRSPFFAAAYAANDVVLIVLWVLAARSDRSYLSVVVCFVMFLANDIYGFINWSKMRRRQETPDSSWKFL